MTLKRSMIMFIVLSLVAAVVLAVPQPALAVPGQCPANTTFIAKYEWDGAGWKAAAGSDVIVFGPGSNLLTGSWTSSVLIAYMVVTDGRTPRPEGGEPIWYQIPYVPPTFGPEEYDAALMLPPQDPPHEISNLVFCGPIWPVTLASFTATASRGTVTINWITATEINTAGFVLYRSTSVDGPKVQVNNLVAAQGGGVTGASYKVTGAPGYGTFYYWLQDVGSSGQSNLYGPVVVKVLPSIRQPVYRPVLPGQ